MTRKLFLDTETTGLHPAEGHRVVEIGVLEVIDGLLTGNFFHTYLNPERESAPEALAVHGLTSEFLSDKPKFADIALALKAFLKDSEIVGHFIQFDLGFLNNELDLILEDRIVNDVICTKALWKRLNMKGGARLDNLCSYYGIDTSHRTIHGAIKDCELTYKVYQRLKDEKMNIKYEAATPEELNAFISKSESAIPSTRNLTDTLIVRMNHTYKQQVALVPTLSVVQADGSVQYGSDRYSRFIKTLQKELDEGSAIIANLQAFESIKHTLPPTELRSQELDHLTDIGDHLTDIIVYCLSEATKFGIPAQQVLRIIQASNQSKLDNEGKPIIDENGKFLKGPNFQPPERFIKAYLYEICEASDTVFMEDEIDSAARFLSDHKEDSV